MSEGNINNTSDTKISKFVRELSTGFKLVIAFFTVVGFIAGTVWQLDSTFASKGEVKAVEVSAEKARVALADESVKTLKQFQDSMRQEQVQRQIKTDVRYWSQLIDSTYVKINDLNNQIRNRPNDVYLKNRLQQEKNNLKFYQQRLNELLK
jgi:hypothetical protein